jgi:hypothetical protein
MNVGSEQYRKALRRYNTLLFLDAPSERQQEEMARLDAQLTAAEMRGRAIRELVDDYAFAVGQAGNLGGTEL